MPITEMLPGGPGRGRTRWGFAAASIAAHAGILAALVVATDSEADSATEAADREEVTYVDIATVAPPPPPPSRTPASPEPRTPQPEPQPQPQPEPQRPEPQPTPEPETPPRAADIVEPEDSVDDPLGEEPVPEVSAPEGPPIETQVPATAPAGEAGEAGGGQAGGVEGGEEGGKVGGVVGGQGEDVPEPGGTYVAAVVDRKAKLSNRRELPRIMERLYPDALRDAGMGGRVIVQFVVTPQGRVDMSTVKIMSASHDGFVAPTRKALGEFRFSPARVGDQKVRMLTQLPIVWEVQ